MALEDNLLWATIWIIIASVFDFLDGLVARLLNAYSPVGKELDSLGDVVSFGVAPGMIVFQLLRGASEYLTIGSLSMYVPYLAFIIPVFSALRLAKFNVDERQTTSFLGLPVPAHALFWSSLSYSLQPIIHHNTTLFVIVIVISSFLTSLLLVSEIPMFSLKIKSLSLKGNEMQYLLLVCSIIFIVFFGFLGITGAIFLYVLLSIFNKKR